MSKAKNSSYFSKENSADVVIARMGDAPNTRLKEVMTSVVQHLHDAIKETRPTIEEWQQAIGILTATGQMCDDKRQEWILLSDVLGVSMLVDDINSDRTEGATENTVLGPFHVDGAPSRELGESICDDGQGEELIVHGRVTDLEGNPVTDAVIDVWQASADGFYDNQQPGVQPEFNLRGVFKTDKDGRYWFRSVKPTYYPIPKDGPVGQMLDGLGCDNIRPAHIHFILAREGYDTVTTHIFDGDDPYLGSDPVFGVRESLVRKFKRVDSVSEMDKRGLHTPFWEVETDFVLQQSNK